jgi:cytochrome c biogenesis protein CcmG, thiol:disulfide interchange protein DsbE
VTAVVRGIRVVALGVVAALLGLLIWKVAHPGSGAGLVREIAAGKRPAAPAFTLRPLSAAAAGASPRLRAAVRRGAVTVADLGGRVTVVNVFASWCIPCKDEAPVLAAAARRHTGRVQFVAWDYQDLAGDGRSFLRRYGNDFVALHDGDGHVAQRWGVTGVPETYVLDPGGRLVAHQAQPVTTADLERLIAAATGTP